MALHTGNTLRSFFSLLVVFFLPQQFFPATTLAQELMIGHFSALAASDDLPENWEPLSFPNIENQTVYRLHDDAGRTVIRAESRNGASGLIHSRRIDPRRYPTIRWTWKIERVPRNGDVSTKSGDDCAARLYVAFAYDEREAGWIERLWHRTSAFFAGKELPGSALTYIWATTADQYSVVDNAYADSAKMIVLQSGNNRSGKWIAERRNILDDYRLAFKREPTEIIGIAIMTDTDNTEEDIVAYYGDIVLVASPPKPVSAK